MFITSLINKDWQQINSFLLVFAILYACVFVAVGIDLVFGVRRAKLLDITRTSSGYARTIKKLTRYFGLLLMLSIADIVSSVLLNIPYFTVIGTMGIVLVEIKSVYQNIKFEDKSIEEIQTAIQQFLENRQNIQSIMDYINKKN